MFLVFTLFPFGLIILIAFVFQLYSTGWITPIKPLIDPSLIISLWLAEVPLALFLSRILGEGSQDRPKLALDKATRNTANFVSVLVRNKGQLSANECEARLHIRKLMDAEEFARLHWTNDAVRIRPDESEPLQLMQISSEGQSITRIQLPLDNGLELPLSMKETRTYRGTIKITAANCKAANRSFKLTVKAQKGRIKFAFV
jgi:hypothetical protein